MNRALTIILVLFLLYATSFLIAKNIEATPLSNKIAVIPIQGIITIGNQNSPLYGSTSSSTTILNFLEAADKDKSIKAILLEINSGGGTPVASAEIASKIKSIEKPTVALIREVGASGAYWIASASDKIVANPLSITGSIGVISSYMEFSDLMQEYGIKYEKLTAGEYKDIGSPYRDLKEQERNLLQQKLNIIHSKFISEVSKNRGINANSYATGLYYLGSEAKDIGLIDELGDKKTALEILKQLADIEKAQLVYYKEQENIVSLLKRFTAQLGLNIGKGISSSLLNQEQQIIA